MEFIETTSLHWYAIHVRSRHEFKVLDRLTKAGVEVFLPTVERLSRWKDRKKLISFPLFPGYLFVHIRKMYKDMMTVLKTHGVVRFISTISGEPEAVPDDQIMSLKIVLENKETVDPYHYLKEGQRVKIKKGPLAGAHGLLVKKESLHMFVLSVDILRQGLSVKVDASDVDTL